MTPLPPLPDGTYDAIVVDAEELSGGPGAGDRQEVRVHLALLAGARKGDVVEVRGPRGADVLDLLGLPATLTVTDGVPSVGLEP